MAGALTAAIAAAFAGSAAPSSDQYFEYTTLLLPGNGTNGAQNNTFLDGSTNNFTITRNGNTTQGTFSPFSQTGWGNYFDGSADYFNVTDAAFNPSGAFTIQLWFYPTDNTTTYQGLVSTWPDGLAPAQGIQIWKASSTGQVSIGNASTGGTTIASFTWASYLNQWNHLAVVRNSSDSCAVFLNGTRLAAPVTKSGSPGQTTLTIGRAFPNNANYYFQGYMSNVSFVSGSNVYDPASSTITVPTTPLSTSTTNQALLTCQANRFIDSNTATTAKTITVNGNPSVQAFSPFNPTASWSAATNGGSGYFDGNGDYLQLPAGTAFAPGTGDFTVDGWFYTTVTTANQIIWSQAVSGTNYFIVWADPSTSTVYFNGTLSGGGVNISSTANLQVNAWNYFSVRRASGTVTVYLNGVAGTPTSNTVDFSNTSYVPTIGRYTHTATNHFTGYIANLRYVKGTAITPSGVPTTLNTAVSGTSALLNFTNAGIYDATSKNDLETVGNAQISTTQSKWGGSSMYFNATNPQHLLLNYPTSQNALNGAFTIEFWIYWVSGTGVILSSDEYTSLIAILSTGKIEINTASSPQSTGAITANTWTYLAFTRNSSGVWTLYINGSADALSLTNTSTYTLRRIAGRSADNCINGYLQDFRVTKGYVRTIATPTSAFPTL